MPKTSNWIIIKETILGGEELLDLFSYSPLKSSYTTIYQSLSSMRELFHRTGRFDDSNAKLDEVVKLLSTYLAYRRRLINHFPSGDEPGRYLITSLLASFGQAAILKCYSNQDGSSMFGSNPMLSLRQEDESLARALVSLVRTAIDSALANKSLDHPFDVLNEAFGHFIRDNFRSNIEDAQYMTPPEVVDLMVNIALHDIESDHQLAINPPARHFLVLDPTCGVGSFLAAFFHRSKTSNSLQRQDVQLIGQDKVERMIRLTKLNLTLFDCADYDVTIGNSLSGDSPVSSLNESIDLILTNPPFGATFSRSDLASFGSRNLPIFAPKCNRLQNVDSELLFIDRNLSLLRDGGRLLIVVPDSVVSAKGLPALLRQQLRGRATVRAVVALPSVTFAQAGTRTRTCILYLTKGTHPVGAVFVARADHIGFEVSTRKGVQQKVALPRNDLPSIFKAYRSFRQEAAPDTRVISRNPSCVSVDYARFVAGSWTPNHHSASRLEAVTRLGELLDTTATPLRNLVEFHAEKRRVEPYGETSYFISVLHVIGEGMLDIHGIRGYSPKTPGIRANPGEILFSRINPRIPRVLVLPDFGRKTICSSEFEIMSAKPGVDPFFVAFLLLSDSVQEQIKSLTSGTSASHNRIKSSDLASILLPVPTTGTEHCARLSKLIHEYKSAVTLLIQQTIRLSNIREEEQKLTVASGRTLMSQV